ncbi:MAG: nitroreductase [Alphaproteobacteria bacterium CG_4_10_14_0_2_um_filter_63_37]|nr:MAG: hypothetical protein AUJ55_12755 [Proteobacteria bacterium CG1_02_64_396]PJA23487.1 MAG: nitroreductase [Alphaproteobacteria bacterium CG_4_10_14_0_2_um_filter_63_37]
MVEPCVIRAIQARRSGRAFSDRVIPPETLTALIEGARWAPSCFNNQPWRFVLSRQNGPTREAIEAALSEGNAWAKKADTLVVVSCDDAHDCHTGGRHYAGFDAGLAVQNLLLTAFEHGLMAHPMAGFQAEPLSEILGMPPGQQILCLIAIGYPGDPSALSEKDQAAETAPRLRRPWDAIAAFDFFGAKMGQHHH